MKLKYISSILFAGLTLTTLTTFTSCNDFLDREPEDKVTPEKFFQSESDLADYAIKYYSFSTLNPGSYGMGTFAADNATDNQAGVDYSNFWVPGDWQVAAKAGDEWKFEQIHHCNYFFEKVLPKYQAGTLKGNPDNIKHYIGEVYFLRAKAYFDKLSTIGDCPIIKEVLADDRKVLLDNSKRQPQHKVARFILEDLDKAIELLKEDAPGGRNRISKNVAYLFRSRVALYEGTWLKYHKGTALVPGGNGWPGDAADVAGFNIDTEIDYFLGEAMTSAQVVADKVVDKLANNTDVRDGQDATLKSANPYFTMFSMPDLASYPEVLMWRQYNLEQGVTHNIQMQLGRNGGGTGYTRGYVNSFLMRNGLPIYDANSGYDSNWEAQGVKATLQNRDSRIQLFCKQDGDAIAYTNGAVARTFEMSWLAKGNNETRIVTGFAVKKGLNYDSKQQDDHHMGVSASVVFRGAEALLNYMEASYEKNHTIDAKAEKYWKALRTRAKVDADFNKTIAATVMAEEAKNDFGAYSHGALVDKTLYNIRRERRDEFIAEGMRLNDLRRWRALDQVNGYQIEGMRYWGSIYDGKLLDKDNQNLVIVNVEQGKGNMSDKNISGVYVRPYQLSKVNNSVFNGYHFTEAHYLTPLAQSVFRKSSTSDNNDIEKSVVYQNPGWPKVAGQGPIGVK